MRTIRMKVGTAVLGLVAGASSGLTAEPHAGTRVDVELRDSRGTSVGSARIADMPNGVLIVTDVTGVPPGERGLHIHDIGRCEPPDFESAGGHFNPTKANHGFSATMGAHAGDLPNIHVPAGGTLRFEYFVPGVRLREGQRRLLDADGAALVIHASPDDYRTDPAGEAGDRIACGVIA
jgi:superoxide dismutase, Cu-Zn family